MCQEVCVADFWNPELNGYIPSLVTEILHRKLDNGKENQHTEHLPWDKIQPLAVWKNVISIYNAMNSPRAQRQLKYSVST